MANEEPTLEEVCLATLLLRLNRNIIPHHEKKLTSDPAQIRKWQEDLVDSVCFYESGKRCSIRCEWFSCCDDCEKPFCMLGFRDVVLDSKVYLCKITGETLCEECHVGCDCYEEVS